MKNAAVENQTPPSPDTNSNTSPSSSPSESISLSREQLNERASVTTQLLAEILQHEEDYRHVTHWGINE